MAISDKYNRVLRVLIIVASLFVIFSGIKTATHILVPFLLSVFIAIMCNPLIKKASEYKVPRAISVTLVIIIFVGLAMIIAGLVGKSLTQLSQSIPEYRAQLKEQFSWVIVQLNERNIHLSADVLMQYFDPGAAVLLAADMLSGVGNVAANLFLIIITVVLILFEAPSIPTKIHLAFADPDMKMKQIDQFLSSVNHYIAIKTVVSVFTGIAVSTMLWVFDLEFYLLWGTLAFLLNYIPNIGSIIAAVPAVLMALLQLTPAEAGLIALGYMVINTIVGNVIEPKYLGKGLGLSTLVVFLSLIFWGWLLGTVGMLLSVPLTMIIKIGFEKSETNRWVAVMLSGDETEKV